MIPVLLGHAGVQPLMSGWPAATKPARGTWSCAGSQPGGPSSMEPQNVFLCNLIFCLIFRSLLGMIYKEIIEFVYSGVFAHVIERYIYM